MTLWQSLLTWYWLIKADYCSPTLKKKYKITIMSVILKYLIKELSKKCISFSQSKLGHLIIHQYFYKWNFSLLLFLIFSHTLTMAKLPRILACVLVVLGFALTSSASTYIVGDSSGWDTSTDLKSWSSDKKFNVGDVLCKYEYIIPMTQRSYFLLIVRASLE